MISLITTVLEAAITIFTFFTRRAQRKKELQDIMDDFSRKHDAEVKKNIRLREEYEGLKRKLREEKEME
jgi:hypothetical protein